MARNTWNIEKKVSGSWTSDGTIYRPNSSMPVVTLSTQTKYKLVDGGNAYMLPSTKYVKEALSFTWYDDDGTLKSKVETYIQNGNDLRITDHNSNQYVGRFVSINAIWKAGETTDSGGDIYDIQAVFEIMPDLA